MARAKQPNGGPLTIGLVNNMPDSAVQQAERQFRRLAGAANIVWRRYTLPGPERSAVMTAFLDRRYDDLGAIGEHGLDGLIVTGAEPRADELRDEPFWPALVALLDWSEASGVPVLLSCLAAHAAVLHRDGIARRRLAAKCSGVFSFETTTHELLDGLPARIDIPHSRLNELPADPLEEAGWRILSRSPTAGVDAFFRDDGVNWLCWQGHPEYEADTLLREFRRDLRRFLHGEQSCSPAVPAFAAGGPDRGITASSPDRGKIMALLERARTRPDQNLLDELADPRLAETLWAEAPWQATGERLFANWLAFIAGARPSTPACAHLASLARRDAVATQVPGTAAR